jgi:hypothetical protein
MKTFATSLLPAAALWAALSFPLLAQQAGSVCPTYDSLAKRLDEIGEHRIGAGPDQRHRLIELWARPDGRTWTLIIRLRDGTACIATFGGGWRPVPGEGA